MQHIGPGLRLHRDGLLGNILGLGGVRGLLRQLLVLGDGLFLGLTYPIDVRFTLGISGKPDKQGGALLISR